MKRKWWNVGLAAALGAGMFLLFPMAANAAPVFPDGISAGDKSLAGMTAEEGVRAVEQYVDELSNRKITLSTDGQKAETTAGELGLYWANPQVVEQAAKEYAGGSLIQQYITEKKLTKAPVALEIETQVDSEKTETFLKNRCRDAEVQAQDASISRENGAFVITDSVVGETVDIGATEAAINAALAEDPAKELSVEAVIRKQEPAVTTEALKTIRDVLGSCTTDFSTSSEARCTNLSVGAAKINGHLLMPGEELSGYECLHPFTTENGYKTSASYENGRVVDSIGGGVCQIATTLYNAALKAELEITQRQNHSMIVTYVEPSMDAAIAGTYKDIKIKNNYETPIYIEGYTEGKNLVFNIYGQETRPENRVVEYVSKTISTTDPGDPQLIEDSSLAPGTQQKVQSSHQGLRSELWKVVTVDGVEQERTLLNQDTYNASKAIYRVGPALAAADTDGTETLEAEAPAENQEAQIITGPSGGPGAVPSETEAADEAVSSDSTGIEEAAQ